MTSTNLANPGLQGVTLAPRFVFGVDGGLKNSLFALEADKLLYVAGNNVIIYQTEERS
jgi:hypothetical protein